MTIKYDDDVTTVTPKPSEPFKNMSEYPRIPNEKGFLGFTRDRIVSVLLAVMIMLFAFALVSTFILVIA